jgi:hypothetical protein
MIAGHIQPEKSADGRPPVAAKNLRVSPVPLCRQETSRQMAAPRRSLDGTCEKPPTDRLSLPRRPGRRQRAVSAAARAVPLLSRPTVHLQTGPHSTTEESFQCQG